MNQQTGKRIYPKGTGHKVLYAKWGHKQYNYIERRKEIYVPKYWNLIKDNIVINIAIVDYDGPKKSKGVPLIEGVNLKM